MQSVHVIGAHALCFSSIGLVIVYASASCVCQRWLGVCARLVRAQSVSHLFAVSLCAPGVYKSVRERWYSFCLAFGSSPFELTVAEPVWSDPYCSFSCKIVRTLLSQINPYCALETILLGLWRTAVAMSSTCSCGVLPVVGAWVRRTNTEILRDSVAKDAGIQLCFGSYEAT